MPMPKVRIAIVQTAAKAAAKMPQSPTVKPIMPGKNEEELFYFTAVGYPLVIEELRMEKDWFAVEVPPSPFEKGGAASTGPCVLRDTLKVARWEVPLS